MNLTDAQRRGAGDERARHTRFALSEIARIEEARIAKGTSELADVVKPWCGGFMCRGAPGLWCNSALGAGLSGAVPDGAVDEMVAFYAENGIEPRIEAAPFIDETLRVQLERAGFVVRMFEMIFARELADFAETTEPGAGAISGTDPLTADVRLEALDKADEPLMREAGTAVLSAFLPAGTVIREEDIAFFFKNVRHPEATTVIARTPAGRVVGVSAVAITPLNLGGLPPLTVAALYGAGVVPEFRKRGIQQAMLAHRLQLAARAGCRIATIGSKPGVATERTVRRLGFDHAYTKVILTRPAPGLMPVIG